MSLKEDQASGDTETINGDKEEADDDDDDDDVVSDDNNDKDNTLDFGFVKLDSIIYKAFLEKCIMKVLLQETIADRKREREFDFAVDFRYYTCSC